MSSDRARTPSPHKAARVEPGVFSSLASFQYYKASGEERKISNPGKAKSPLPMRPKSPVKPPVVASPARPAKAQVAPRTPERTHSPGLTRATTAQVDHLRNADELLRLQDSVKKLTAQLAKERKSTQTLEQRLQDEETAHKQEQTKLRNDLVGIQQTVHKWKSQQHDKLSAELTALKSAIDTSRMHIKGLVGVFVSVLEQLLANNVYSDELMLDPLEEERMSALEGIQKLIVGKLETVAAGTGTDLEDEITSVCDWTSKPTYQLPKQMPTSKPAHSDSFAMDLEDESKPFPQISYSVEYFNEDTPVESEPEALHPLNPLRALEENKRKTDYEDDKSPEIDQLKLRIINRMKGRTEDSPSKPASDIAIAQYDFDGERVGAM